MSHFDNYRKDAIASEIEEYFKYIIETNPNFQVGEIVKDILGIVGVALDNSIYEFYNK